MSRSSPARPDPDLPGGPGVPVPPPQPSSPPNRPPEPEPDRRPGAGSLPDRERGRPLAGR